MWVLPKKWICLKGIRQKGERNEEQIQNRSVHGHVWTGDNATDLCGRLKATRAGLIILDTAVRAMVSKEKGTELLVVP